MSPTDEPNKLYSSPAAYLMTCQSGAVVKQKSSTGGFSSLPICSRRKSRMGISFRNSLAIPVISDPIRYSPSSVRMKETSLKLLAANIKKEMASVNMMLVLLLRLP